VVRLVKSLRDALGSLKHPGGVITAVGLIAIAAGTLAGIRLIPMPEMAAGPIIGTGTTLFAMGLSELLKFYRSTTELEKPIVDLEKLGQNLYRVSALIYNPGNVTVKDAKAVLTVEIEPQKLRKMQFHCLQVSPFSGRFRFSDVNPRIVGEALPWTLSEKPISLPVSRWGTTIYMNYAHITSISPRQRARLLLFDFAKYGDGYFVGIFTEYSSLEPDDPLPRYYRACLYIDEEIKAKVYVSGEGLRKPLEFCLSIRKDVLDEVKNLVDSAYEDKNNMAYFDEAIKKLQNLLNC